MSYVLCPMSYVWGLWTLDFGLGAKGPGLGQDGLRLYGVNEVADVLKPVHLASHFNLLASLGAIAKATMVCAASHPTPAPRIPSQGRRR